MTVEAPTVADLTRSDEVTVAAHRQVILVENLSLAWEALSRTVKRASLRSLTEQHRAPTDEAEAAAQELATAAQAVADAGQRLSGALARWESPETRAVSLANANRSTRQVGYVLNLPVR